MAIERYKIIYTGNTLSKVLEITSASGVLLSEPIVHTSSDGDWGSFLSGIATCTNSSSEVIQSCLFDNTTGDYLNLVPFVRYTTLDTISGDVAYLGDYKHTASGVFAYSVIGTPVATIGEETIGSQCRRNVLNGSGTWALTTYPLAFRVELYAVSGSPSILDANGDSTEMFAGERVVFEANGDGAGLLTDDLTISAGAGEIVTINWTELKT